MVGRQVSLYNYEDLEAASEGFRTLIGGGGFGEVYQGNLNGTDVAIKRLSQTSMQGDGEFIQEVQVLSGTRHQNVLPLLGFSCNKGQRCLVYPLMANGSLYDVITSRPGDLRGLQRIRVAQGSAAGLTAIHAQGMIHRDIKSSNILLDTAFNPKIADVGLVKEVSHDGATITNNVAMGTFGYIAPEYQEQGTLSRRSDVYSLGVVLLELLSGEPAHNPRLQPPLLVGRVRARLRADRNAMSAIGISQGWPGPIAEGLGRVAMRCVAREEADRPTAAEVEDELNRLVVAMGSELGITELDRAQSLRGFVDPLDVPSPPGVTGASECVVCMAQPRGARLRACGHVSTCADCAAVMFSQGMGCPICMAPVEANGWDVGDYDSTFVPVPPARPPELSPRPRAPMPPALPPEGLRSLRQETDPRVVVTTMRANARDASVAEAGCRALSYQSATADSQLRAAAAGGIEVTVEAMVAHQGNSLLQEAACGALREMAGNAYSQVRAASSGAIEAAVAAMQGHCAMARVQEAACLALRNMARSADGEARAVRAGAVEAAVDSLRLHEGNPGVLQSACECLYNLTSSPVHQARAGAAGAVEAATAAVHARTAHPGVQEAAWGAISHMALDPGNKARAAHCGAVEMVVESMRLHPGSPAVLEAACGALGNISNLPANRLHAMGSGGVEAVVAAMRGHQRNPLVQRAACSALGNLADNPKVEARCFATGAIDHAVKALLNHKAEAPVVSIACGALRVMTRHADHEAKAVGLGAVELAVGAMAAHPAHALTQQAACEALNNLVFGPGHAERAVAAGACERAAGAMRAHGAHAGAQWAACGLLATLAVHPAGRQRVADVGAAAAAVHAMRTHQDHVGVQEAACGLLANLAPWPGGRDHVGGAGGVEAACAAAARHPASAAVQEAACGALANMTTSHAANAGKAVEAGAVDVAADALKTHRKARGVVRASRALLTSLGRGDLARGPKVWVRVAGGLVGLVAIVALVK